MRGSLIALIGADGTGKSALAAALKEKFESMHYQVTVVPMGVSNPILPTSKLILKLGLLRRNNQRIKFFEAPSTLFRFNPIKEITFLHYLFELFMRYWVWLRPKVARGEIVITDRYIYDFLIIPRWLNNFNFFKKLVIRLIPTPNLLVCAYNTPEVIAQRKNDNTNSETQRQTELFISLEKEVTTFRKIKTDGSVDSSADKIIKEWRMLRGAMIKNQDKNDSDYRLAAESLRALLKNDFADFESLIKAYATEQVYLLCRRNNVVIRVAEALSRSKDAALASQWSEIFQKEKGRAEGSVALIKEISRYLEAQKIPFVVIKTLDSFPDFGNDVDIFVSGDFRKVRERITKIYNPQKKQRKVSDILCGKLSVKINEFPLLELHCRKMGQVGEQVALALSLTKNRRLFEGEGGIRAYIPSKEEQIIIITIHRLYRHLSFKVSDIVNAIALLKEPDFNWERLFKLSEDCGMSKGIAYLLGMLENIHIAYFDKGLIPERHKGLIDSGSRLSFRHWFFRIPLFRVPPKLYAAEAFYFLKRGRIGSVARLSLIPVLSLMAYASIKIFKDDWVW